MKYSNRLQNIQRQHLSLRLGGLAVLGIGLMLYFIFFVGINTTMPTKEAKASTNMTFPSGSFIVNMGIIPQSDGNGLHPYGMVYEMITRFKIPVYWSIEPTKIKDGVDFTYSGTVYKGGPFVIHANSITTQIRSRINAWRNMGVIGDFITSSITIPIYSEIKYYPRVLVDDLSGNEKIITSYFDDAMIPEEAYTIGNPDDAGVCFDVWVNPHGDPTWETHGNLKTFVENYQGFIWSQCHAVSMLEGCEDTLDPTTQMNFLSVDGLKCFSKKLNACGPSITEDHPSSATTPYTQHYPADPIMQFMENAAPPLWSNGSEHWFIPQTTGGWRPTTRRTITTSDSIPPFEGILQAYGPAYGDTTNGWVMYSAGHDHNSGGNSKTEKVAAKRTFHNFMLLCGKLREPLISSSIDAEMTGLNWYDFSVTSSGGTPPLTYSWSSNIGGTFYSPDSSSTVFLSPSVVSPVAGAITCTVTDACDRVMFATQFVTVSPSPLPITLTEFTASPKGMNKVITEWVTESEINNKHFTIERSKDAKNYTIVGNVRSQGNSVSTKYYTLTDYEPYNGTSYYRLSQTDLDGLVRYFDPVAVKMNIPVVQEKASVAPNPFRTYFELEYKNDEELEVVARLYDITGKMITEKVFYSNSGTSLIRFDNLGMLNKGHYILRLDEGKEEKTVLRLVKK